LAMKTTRRANRATSSPPRRKKDCSTSHRLPTPRARRSARPLTGSSTALGTCACPMPHAITGRNWSMVLCVVWKALVWEVSHSMLLGTPSYRLMGTRTRARCDASRQRRQQRQQTFRSAPPLPRPFRQPQPQP
jgi:hypothetical protein